MQPILFSNKYIIVDAYSSIVFIAWIVGCVVFYYEAKRRNWAIDKLLIILGACIVGAVLGSFLFSVFFTEWENIPENTRLLNFTGKTILGGLAGGFLAVEITKKRIGYTQSTGDAFALAIPLGHAIGRLGCFFGGCCYGTESNLPWAVNYPLASLPYMDHLLSGKIVEDATHSLAVHPTQLYEVVFNVLLFIFLYKRRDSFKVSGSLFRLYLASYLTFRFFLEFIRGDSPIPVDFWLKPIQVLLLIVAAYFSWKFYKNEFKTKVA